MLKKHVIILLVVINITVRHSICSKSATPKFLFQHIHPKTTQIMETLINCKCMFFICLDFILLKKSFILKNMTGNKNNKKHAFFANMN